VDEDRIIIPHQFIARDYQIPFLNEVEKAISGESNKRFFYQVWHRRSGKDKSNIADVVPRRLIKDPVTVKYVFPTLVMGRNNLWNAIGKDASGDIKITLWNDDIGKVKAGDKVKIENGYVSEWQGEMQLSTGKLNVGQ